MYAFNIGKNEDILMYQSKMRGEDFNHETFLWLVSVVEEHDSSCAVEYLPHDVWNSWEY